MTVPFWLCIPFAGMLLSVALFPIFAEEFWETKKQYVVAFWSLITIVLFAVVFGAAASAETVLECLFNDYLTFIVLFIRTLLCIRQYFL